MHIERTASLATFLVAAGCALDWDRLDPALGAGGGGGGSPGGGGVMGGSGGTGGGGAQGGAAAGGQGGTGGTLDSCGDGVIDPGEECDDGNDQAGDLCDVCVVECDGTKDASTFHCYRLDTQLLSWAAARVACQAWGGDLVSITSADEHDLVNTLYGTTPGPYWIGGNDIAREGVYVWSNGDPWVYESWDDSQMEPNDDGAGLQNCIDVFDDLSAEPLFGDNPCGNESQFVCERPPP